MTTFRNLTRERNLAGRLTFAQSHDARRMRSVALNASYARGNVPLITDDDIWSDRFVARGIR